MKRIIHKRLPIYQRGAASLLISLVLLTVITFVSLYTSRSVLMEQKISSNEYRSRIAFETAEAGAEDAIAYINWGGKKGDRNDDGALDPVFDTNGDGIGDSNTADIQLADGTVTGHVALTLTNVSSGGTFAIKIESTGTSPDNTASRTITQVLALVPGIPNVPDNPLLTRGSIVIDGSATVYNDQGASTIWSGSAVDLGSNNSTHTQIANPDDPNYPDCLGGSVDCGTVNSSDRYTAGLDIIENDDSLAHLTDDEFFKNFFGALPETYHDSRVTLDVLAANVDQYASADPPGIRLATNEVIWVEGDTSIDGGTVGCASAVVGAGTCPTADLKPSIVIINGDATFSGTPHFYGLLYVTGNVSVSGNLDITGAMVVQGANLNTSGSLNVKYDSGVLGKASDSGGLGNGGGSWRDFE